MITPLVAFVDLFDKQLSLGAFKDGQTCSRALSVNSPEERVSFFNKVLASVNASYSFSLVLFS